MDNPPRPLTLRFKQNCFSASLIAGRIVAAAPVALKWRFSALCWRMPLDLLLGLHGLKMTSQEDSAT